MTDGITMGAGNSRYLRSVSGFLSLYPTYEAFAQALISGTLPIDLNGLNPDGWAQEGTELNKANLLTDATAAIMGLGSEATPNDMLAALANKAAQTVPVERGGTGGTTLAEAKENLQIPTIVYGTTEPPAWVKDLPDGSIYAMYK